MAARQCRPVRYCPALSWRSAGEDQRRTRHINGISAEVGAPQRRERKCQMQPAYRQRKLRAKNGTSLTGGAHVHRIRRTRSPSAAASTQAGQRGLPPVAPCRIANRVIARPSPQPLGSQLARHDLTKGLLVDQPVHAVPIIQLAGAVVSLRWLLGEVDMAAAAISAYADIGVFRIDRDVPAVLVATDASRFGRGSPLERTDEPSLSSPLDYRLKVYALPVRTS